MPRREHPLRRFAFPPTPIAAGDGQASPHCEGDPVAISNALRERIKELNCLYGIARLHQVFPESLDMFLEGVVNILPHSWQYPDVTCVRITFRDKAYTSSGFRTSPWRQAAKITVRQEKSGEVEVYYLEERPKADIGPFLKEEQALLNTVADNIALNATRIEAENELREVNRLLQSEQQALKGANETLRTLLSRLSDEKLHIQSEIHANVEKVLKPLLLALAMELSPGPRKYVDLILDNLAKITTPFVGTQCRDCERLTPTEINICTMIRGGLKTKEIAELRGVSPATIHRHRERIRRKLGLTGRDVNLATRLQNIL